MQVFYPKIMYLCLSLHIRLFFGMSFIGNILWIILGGFLLFLMYFYGGMLI